MATVTTSTPSCKPQAYYATFHGLSGVLTKPADHVLFLEHESGAVVTVTDADSPHVIVLGAVADAMHQYISDMASGGYAAQACSRANLEVSHDHTPLSPRQCRLGIRRLALARTARDRARKH